MMSSFKSAFVMWIIVAYTYLLTYLSAEVVVNRSRQSQAVYR